ncbi:alpha-hydroxy-acid oxidizing protein [Kitasatospora sp. NPDC057542]|uniref:alpha-hydroxy-acid oxidizing protein n=1 Tax=Kitasatospora sp. NPDC057542 TaxID=3346162 RepID=UPI0036B5730F
MGVLTPAGIERAARAQLPPETWDFIEGGSGEERTLAADREMFGRHALRPRTLVDVSACDPARALSGRPRLADLDRTALAPWPRPVG